jgi:hypothetical protein
MALITEYPNCENEFLNNRVYYACSTLITW